MVPENNFLIWSILPNGNVIGQRDQRQQGEKASWWLLGSPRAAGRQAALSHCCGNADAKAALLQKVLFVSCIFYLSSLFTSICCSCLSLSLWDKIIFINEFVGFHAEFVFLLLLLQSFAAIFKM